MSLTSYWPDEVTWSPLAAWKIEKGNVFLLWNPTGFWHCGTHWGWWEEATSESLPLLAHMVPFGKSQWPYGIMMLSQTNDHALCLRFAFCLLTFSPWLWPFQKTALSVSCPVSIQSSDCHFCGPSSSYYLLSANFVSGDWTSYITSLCLIFLVHKMELVLLPHSIICLLYTSPSPRDTR